MYNKENSRGVSKFFDQNKDGDKTSRQLLKLVKIQIYCTAVLIIFLKDYGHVLSKMARQQLPNYVEFLQKHWLIYESNIIIN